MQITGVRAAFYQQGEDLPYAQVYRPISPPPEGEPVIIGGNFSLKRPGFPDTAALRLSRPVVFQPGDWVRIWLAPEGDTPDYLGQVVSEAWTEGAGEVQMRSLLERVNKCAWSGKEEGEFSDFWSSVLARASLPKGIRFRLQPDINARFAADTPFELLGDTIQAITPALGGYVIGVSSSGVIETRRPSLELTHRFVLGQSEMPQGDATNYANCVRFSFELPSGDTGWFEGKNGPEVKRQGEVWAVENLTAREVGQPEEPLAETAASVHMDWLLAGQQRMETVSAQPLSRALQSPPRESLLQRSELSAPYTTPLLEYPDLASWASAVQYDHRADQRNGAKIEVSSNTAEIVARLQERLLEDGQTVDPKLIEQQLEVRLRLRYTPGAEREAQTDGGELTADEVLCVIQDGKYYTGPDYIDTLEWPEKGEVTVAVRINPAATEGVVLGSSQTTKPASADIRPAFYALTVTYRLDYRRKLHDRGILPERLEILDGGEVGGTLELNTPQGKIVIQTGTEEQLFMPPTTTGKQQLHAEVKRGENDDIKEVRLELPFPLPQPDKTPLEYAQMTTRRAGAAVITLPQPVTLEAGSAVTISLPAGGTLGALHTLPEKLGDVTRQDLGYAEAAYLYTTVNKLGRALPRTEQGSDETARFAVRGEDLTVQTFILTGINDLTGTANSKGQEGLQILTPQLDTIQTYAAELLRYRAQPVRDWRGFYPELQRVEADGIAAFERPGGQDEQLDVQRVTYDLEKWTVEVQAGTPLPATDEDAVAGVVESLQRVQRRAGGAK